MLIYFNVIIFIRFRGALVRHLITFVQIVCQNNNERKGKVFLVRQGDNTADDCMIFASLLAGLPVFTA